MAKKIRHLSEAELRSWLERHAGRVECQCLDCLYHRWYWRAHYGMDYPNRPQTIRNFLLGGG